MGTQACCALCAKSELGISGVFFHVALVTGCTSAPTLATKQASPLW